MCESDRKTIASDINKDLILMWKALQQGWTPPNECSEIKYNELKYDSKNSPERGFIGVVASWSGIFFHAYRLKYAKGKKNFMDEGYRGIMKVVPIVKNVEFSIGSYDEHSPENMLIYCDPPYLGNKLGNKNHSFFRNFDHDKFWDIMRKWSTNNIVIISESNAPSDFKKVWSSESSTIIKLNKQKKYIDNFQKMKRLFQIIHYCLIYHIY